MQGPWTIGLLANHIWSFAGDSDRDDISDSFVQPWVAYTWSNAWTASIQSETTYNWKSEQWSIPLNVAVSKLVRIGKLPVSLQAGVINWEPEKEAWELYNLDKDYSQSKDIAKENPKKLAELKTLFDKEAAENHVYPIGASY